MLLPIITQHHPLPGLYKQKARGGEDKQSSEAGAVVWAVLRGQWQRFPCLVEAKGKGCSGNGRCVLEPLPCVHLGREMRLVECHGSVCVHDRDHCALSPVGNASGWELPTGKVEILDAGRGQTSPKTDVRRTQF